MYANIFRINWVQTVRIKMTFPYGECRWFAASRPPFGAVAEHKVVSRRLGFRRHGRPIVAAVRREAESTRRRAVPRVANAGEGRAVDAERRGNTCKESRG